MDLDADEAAFFDTLLDGLRRALHESNLLDETIPVRPRPPPRPPPPRGGARGGGRRKGGERAPPLTKRRGRCSGCFLVF